METEGFEKPASLYRESDGLREKQGVRQTKGIAKTKTKTKKTGAQSSQEKTESLLSAVSPVNKHRSRPPHTAFFFFDLHRVD